MSLNRKYLELIEPENIIEQFNSDDEFIEWLMIDENGTHLDDLYFTLKKFEYAEMYYYCEIIKTVIEEVYMDKMLKFC